ncbi:hypothetical protein AGMMS50276_22160 [Synergistales bacterium]|nr:hypothetical protein AGMMS50276_22160 [Synergistales bacterium]
MKIIDTHTHLGTSRQTDSVHTEEIWLSKMKRYNLDGLLSYPLPSPYPDAPTMHDRIHKFANDNPGRVWGVVDINPIVDEDEYFKEATRCVKELGFVAIKMHPSQEATNPLSKHAVKVFEAAKMLNVPLIVHTGPGVPYSLPCLLIPRVKEYSTLRIVLAHAGAFLFTDEAIIMAKNFDNVYLEPSWCGAPQLRQMVDVVGIERLMFGSDGPLNVGPSIAQVEAIDMTDREKELYLGKNAIDFYGLKI